MRYLLIWALSALPLMASDDRAGAFDYYVLALSWSPNWCALEGDRREAEQCDTRHAYGWTLHGLWPQYHRGYPSFCRTRERQPSRTMTAEMVDIMGSSGLAWHQWRKHGFVRGSRQRITLRFHARLIIGSSVPMSFANWTAP